MTDLPDSAGLPEQADVAIIGGGPAGLGAAVRLRALGIDRVVVLDREPALGGIPRHCGHYPFGMREFHRLLKGPDYARRLVATAREAGVGLYAGVTVVGMESDGGDRILLVTNAQGVGRVRAKRIMICTGVRERSRAARLVGGERLQGVLSTGALQSLVYLSGLAPFSRPVIVGTELVSFSALLTCRHAGIRPVAMLESRSHTTAQEFCAGLPLILGIPLYRKSKLLRIEGARDRVEAVVFTDSKGQERRLDADGVLLTGSFLPEASLARRFGLVLDVGPHGGGGTGGPAVDQYGRTSDPAVFVAGNVLRPVETAGWSFREGQSIADCVARDLRIEPTNGQTPKATDVPLLVDGKPLRYVMPQRLSFGNESAGMRHAQLRMSARVSGQLAVHRDGAVLWSGSLKTGPERRILVPLEPLLRSGPGPEPIHFSFQG